MTLYTGEPMAAREFERMMAAPYVLTRFLGRVSWSTSVIPTLVHPPSVIAVPVLEDLSGYERMLAKKMISDLG